MGLKQCTLGTLPEEGKNVLAVKIVCSAAVDAAASRLRRECLEIFEGVHGELVRQWLLGASAT